MNAPLPPITHLLYLHGFRSSPQSTKAQMTRRWVDTHAPHLHWWCPGLPVSPQAASKLIAQQTANWPSSTMAVIGSSLGGFYATWLAQRRGCRAVVINPSVQPAHSLARYIGTHPMWHDPSQHLDFAPGHVDELRQLQCDLHYTPLTDPRLGWQPGALSHPERILAVLGTDDEVLSFADMQARYAGCPQRIVPGGDHALANFDELLPEVMAFLGL
jgi:predicted esterase YcpF (UPF0227 family)